MLYRICSSLSSLTIKVKKKSAGAWIKCCYSVARQRHSAYAYAYGELSPLFLQGSGLSPGISNILGTKSQQCQSQSGLGYGKASQISHLPSSRIKTYFQSELVVARKKEIGKSSQFTYQPCTLL